MCRRPLRAAPLALAFAVLAATLAVATPARAQIHWDAGLEGGVMKRFLGARTIHGNPGFGPFLEAEAHVALLPLVRVGAYVGHDISPMPDPIAARDITWGGLHLKIMSPWPRGDVRLWLYTGLGYAGVSARSYASTINAPTGIGGENRPVSGTVQSAGGGYFEVPIGIGASYKLRDPVLLFATLGAQLGFGFSGSVYEDPGPQFTSPGRPDDNVGPAGHDQYAISLSVGALLDL